MFPKHDSLDTTVTYGNFIDAPLFGALVPKGRTVFVDPADPTKLHGDQWAVLESVKRVSEPVLDDVIEINGLGQPDASSDSRALGSNDGLRWYGLPPFAQTMLADGVAANQGVACFRLAVGLKRSGLPFDSTVAVLMDWATRNQPEDGKPIITEPEIASQAACAYDKAYRACGCEDPSIEPYGPPSCPAPPAEPSGGCTGYRPAL